MYSDKQHHIATPNPEFLLESLQNPEFKKVLQNTSLNIPDGIGILWATTIQEKIKKNKKNRTNAPLEHLFSSPILKYILGIKYLATLLINPKSCKKIIPERITGTDLMAEIFRKFPDKKIFLLGAKEGIAEKAVKNLKCQISRQNDHIRLTNTKFQNSKLYDYFSGTPKAFDEKEISTRINSFKPDILFVAFGSPNQELWIAKNLSKIPSVKIAIGVGGAFDFFAGEKKRAPKIFQKLGIEWLYRLFIEPKRWKRIFNAVVIFPWKFLKSL